jgi:hypothetical protein
MIVEHRQPPTRDTLAAQLRRHGHPIRNATVSGLLGALKQEMTPKPHGQAAPTRLKNLPELSIGDDQAPACAFSTSP